MRKTFYRSRFRTAGSFIAAMCVPFLLPAKSLDHPMDEAAVLALSPYHILDELLEEQAVVITGKVVSSADGQGIPGVSILLKGTTIGTVTDLNGDFQLDAGDGSGTLVISSIGFATQEIAINGRSVINVTLAEDIQGLDEVIVVGFGTQKRANVTGAVSTLSGGDIARRPVTNAASALQGMTPGLT